MTTGFRNDSGVDLDNVFDPYVLGTKPAATGFTVLGTDLRDRYAPLFYGDAAAATGLKIASSADLNTLFAAKGSAGYITLVNGVYQNPVAFGSTPFEFSADGTIFTVAGSPVQPTWVTPQVGMNKWEVKATQVSRSGVGTFVGVLDNWLTLGSTAQVWSANRPAGAGAGTDEWVLSFSLRRISDLFVGGTAQITLRSAG